MLCYNSKNDISYLAFLLSVCLGGVSRGLSRRLVKAGCVEYSFWTSAPDWSVQAGRRGPFRRRRRMQLRQSVAPPLYGLLGGLLCVGQFNFRRRARCSPEYLDLSVFRCIKQRNAQRLQRFFYLDRGKSPFIGIAATGQGEFRLHGLI